MDIEHFSDMEAEMIESGLERGLLPSPECNEDRTIVERDFCPECGGAVTFEAYSRYRGHNWAGPQWTYRAFGVCRQCDAAFEF